MAPKYVGLLVVLLFIPHVSFGASFICKGKLSKAEMLICSDNNLSKLDDKLNIAYAIANRVDSSIKDSQKKWIKERNACGDVDCMTSAYENRINAIETLIKDYSNSFEVDEQGWPSGSSMAVGLWYAEKCDRLVRLYKIAYELLLSIINDIDIVEHNGKKYKNNERVIRAVESQHTAWLEYIGKECELVGSLTGAGGTWPTTYGNECYAKAMEERFNRVRSINNCIIELDPGNKKFQYMVCLGKLAYVQPEE